ncbi:MAG: hypothetical protein IJA69_05520, partial [Clostridia bacterium]|nr:hypothetical protein [Clostridia bacterium]
TFLFTLSEAQLEAYTLLMPFLTEKVQKIFANFNVETPTKIDEENHFNLLKATQNVTKGENTYNRLDIAKEMEELYAIANA